MKIKLQKNHILPIILFFIVVLIYFLSSLNNKSESSQMPKVSEITSSPEYFSTEKDVGSTTHLVGSQEDYDYTIYVERNQKIDYYIEKSVSSLEFKTLTGYIDSYGVYNLELYGPWFDKNGFRSYVFLDAGIVVVAHPRSKVVIEVWHVDNNLSSVDFLARFSSQFSQKEPSSVNLH